MTERVCDHCGKAVHQDINGYWVGEDETSNCPGSAIIGHEVNGQTWA